MTYVLVSLVGDDVTQQADVFARQVGELRSPLRAFHEPSPAHEVVAAANDAVRKAVVVGHNGCHDGSPSLRAHAGGGQWADGEKLGEIFQHSRVYAYACETMGSRGEPDVEALGNLACRAGVAAFAGHAVFVDIGWQQSLASAYRERVTEAVSQMIFAFLDGENDADQLRLIARG